MNTEFTRSARALSQSAKIDPVAEAGLGLPAIEVVDFGAAAVAGRVIAKLKGYDGKGTPTDEDGLFLDHTRFIKYVLGHDNLWLAPIEIWKQNLTAIVDETEQRIGRKLHKGAPFFNMGVILFHQNDFEGAYFYFSQAETQDMAGGTYTLPKILIGDHALSNQMLVAPLVNELLPQWANEYQVMTNRVLNEAEFMELMKWLVNRPSDAFLFLTALHRLRRAITRDNAIHSVRLVKVRILADLVIVIESALRRFQPAAVTGQLKPRLQAALGTNHTARTAYNQLGTYSDAVPMADRETAVGANAVVQEGVTRFDATASQSEKAGIAAFVCYRIRNSVLHVNEENLDVFTDHNLVLRMLGWAIATCRTAKHADDNTLAVLP